MTSNSAIGSAGLTSSQAWASSAASAAGSTIAKSYKAATDTSDSGSGGATISLAARIKAAEVADNAKDFSQLQTDVRSDLDKQYAAQKAAGTPTKPDLSEMSGRALAAIVLNKSGGFSKQEVQAARQEMNGRVRADLVGGGMSASGIAAYSQQLISDYQGMSDEEREARGLSSSVIDAATSVVQQLSSGTSLFDKL